MSLYNALHGVSAVAPFVVFALGVKPSDVPRLRDAYIELDEEQNASALVLLARIGGGNRPDYEEGIEMLRQLPGFLSDDDDEFDSTFALFRYAVPEDPEPRSLILAAVQTAKEADLLSRITRPSLREMTEALTRPTSA